MFKRLTTIRIGTIEFLYKFLLVLSLSCRMHGRMLWIGVQADAALNIHFLSSFSPHRFTVGLFFTALLLQPAQGSPSYGGRSVNRIPTAWSQPVGDRWNRFTGEAIHTARGWHNHIRCRR